MLIFAPAPNDNGDRRSEASEALETGARRRREEKEKKKKNFPLCCTS